MKKHPTLSASEAMKLAGFSDSDIKNRSIHRLLYRRLEGNSKRSNPVVEVFLQTPQPASTDVSPLTNRDTASSATTSTTNGASLPRQPKIRRLNSWQNRTSVWRSFRRSYYLKKPIRLQQNYMMKRGRRSEGCQCDKCHKKSNQNLGWGPAKPPSIDMFQTAMLGNLQRKWVRLAVSPRLCTKLSALHLRASFELSN